MPTPTTFRVLLAVSCVFVSAPARAERPPTPVPAAIDAFWLPGELLPYDRDGNRVLAHAPSRPAAAPPDDFGGVAGNSACGELDCAPFGPSGADAESISASPTVAGAVIVGVSSSVGGGAIYRTTNSGTSWTVATGTGNRAVREVEFGGDGAGWAATDDGLFRSADNGATWTGVALPIVGQAVVRDVAVDAANAAVVWVGIGQLLNGTSPLVILRSTDSGANWSDLSPPVAPGMGATCVAIDPGNSQRVYAAFTPNFGGSGELWVTTDGGTNWAQREGGLPPVPFNDIAFGNGLAYVAGGQDFGNQLMGLYSTPDDGLNWTEISAAWPSRAGTSIAIDPADSQRVFVGTTRAGLAYSTDGGANWTHSAGGTGTYQVNDVELSPTAAATIFLGMGSIAVLRSTDSGATYLPASSGISRLEITSFAVNPLNHNEIAASYIGVNDGGIFISTDAGQTWTLSAAPLPRWLRVYFAPDGTLFGTHNGPLGRADDGLWRRNPNGTWSNLWPASPATLDNIGRNIVATAGPDPVVFWCGYRNLPTDARFAQIFSFNRTAPNTFELEHQGTAHNEHVYSMVLQGPVAVATLVNFEDGMGGILRSSDSGDTWARSEAGYSAGWHAWDLDAGPGGALYAMCTPNTSQTPGSVFKSGDGGLNWTQQGTYPVYRYGATDPHAPSTLYALSPFNNARPQRSTDDGAAFTPFDTNFIPQGGGRDIVHGGTVGGQRRLYVATGTGGFASEIPRTPPCPADANCDGVIDFFDIDPFLLALFDPPGYAAAFPLCDRSTADVNGDGVVDFFDIDPFLACLFGTCP